MPENTPRPFVWYELLTTDPEAARTFYTEILGWGTEVFSGAGSPYTMFTNEGKTLGGVMQKPPGSEGPASWLGYVGVEDVDATARRAVERGGKTYVEPRDIPEAGRFAVLADPQGAMFAIYKPLKPAPAPPAETPPGDVSWHELATTDSTAAWDFYADLFGWQRTDSFDMGPAGMYEMFGYGGPSMGAVYPKPAEMTGPPAWTFYVRVHDLDGTVAKATERGGRVLNGPMEVPGGDRIAVCADPQGAVFALHERKS